MLILGFLRYRVWISIYVVFLIVGNVLEFVFDLFMINLFAAMSDRPRLPYQTPGSGLSRSPPRRESQDDVRRSRVSSGAKASYSREEVPSTNPSGSRRVVDRAVSRPRDGIRSTQSPTRAVCFDVPPLRSVEPERLPPPPISSFIGKNTKGSVPRVESSKNPSLKRKASEDFIGSSGPAEEDEAAPLIRSVSVSKKKVTFKHIDLKIFK